MSNESKKLEKEWFDTLRMGYLKSSNNLEETCKILKKIAEISIEDSETTESFTNIAMDYLKSNNCNELYNVFEESCIDRKWRYPPHYEFQVDGLIFDEKNNVLYLIESKFHLTEDEISKSKTTMEKLEKFLLEKELEGFNS